ncbi:MAG: DUF6145 family protein [Clostridiales bacterium]|nr:DUF6145 family protein [Clostridiales bacterium]
MFEEKKILCGASRYEQLFYFNPEFDSLPKEVKDELKILCVLYTEEIGGTFRLEYDEQGTLHMTVESKEDDFLFDEIGSALKIKQIQQEKRDLLESLEMYYKVFFLQEGEGKC